MFFPITRRTLLKKPEKFLAKVASTKPRNWYFLLLKHVSSFFIPTSQNIIQKYVWTKKLYKKTLKHQNQVWGTKYKKTINLKQLICSCNMDSNLIF
jgi:hypothetical protein